MDFCINFETVIKQGQSIENSEGLQVIMSKNIYFSFLSFFGEDHDEMNCVF